MKSAQQDVVVKLCSLARLNEKRMKELLSNVENMKMKLI